MLSLCSRLINLYTNMYIIIKNEPLKVITFETKTDLASYLNIHRNTITNRFKEKSYWESDKGMVYQSNEHYQRTRKGNRDSNETKLRKKNREIPCNNPKLNKGYID